jgi:uncharacterized protein YbaA (DUF1428 family)
MITQEKQFVASCNTNKIFWWQYFQTAEKKSAENKCLLSSPKMLKFHTAEITGYTV